MPGNMAVFYQHMIFVSSSDILLKQLHAQTATLGVNKRNKSLFMWRIYLLTIHNKTLLR
jgi:hypothetical protein